MIAGVAICPASIEWIGLNVLGVKRIDKFYLDSGLILTYKHLLLLNKSTYGTGSEQVSFY